MNTPVARSLAIDHRPHQQAMQTGDGKGSAIARGGSCGYGPGSGPALAWEDWVVVLGILLWACNCALGLQLCFGLAIVLWACNCVWSLTVTCRGIQAVGTEPRGGLAQVRHASTCLTCPRQLLAACGRSGASAGGRVSLLRSASGYCWYGLRRRAATRGSQGTLARTQDSLNLFVGSSALLT
jgi:hypothetical protein